MISVTTDLRMEKPLYEGLIATAPRSRATSMSSGLGTMRRRKRATIGNMSRQVSSVSILNDWTTIRSAIPVSTTSSEILDTAPDDHSPLSSRRSSPPRCWMSLITADSVGMRTPLNPGPIQEPASTNDSSSAVRLTTGPFRFVVLSRSGSWRMTGTPSALVEVSTSMKSTPRARAASTAARLFSGTTAE